MDLNPATKHARRALSAVLLFILSANSMGAEVHLLRVPNGGIQPQAAAGEDGTIHLIYFKGDAMHGDVYYTNRAFDSDSWRDPIQVNTLEKTVVAAGTVRGAHLALGANDRIHVAWMSADGGGLAGERAMYYTRMKLKGPGFEPQRNVIQHAYGLDGGGTISADREGNVYVVWHAGEDGEASRRVFVAKSNDSGQTFGTDTATSDGTAGACGCCGIRSAAGPGGVGYVLYRTAREEIHRDANLIVFGKDSAYNQITVEPWELNACPMSTASLLPDSTGVSVAWETDGQVSWARYGADGDRIMGPFAASGSGGARKHPVLAGNDRGETILAWTDGTGWKRGGTFAWQVYDGDGRPTPERGASEGIPTWSTVSVLTDTSGAFILIH
jgi:hypothetical protein